MSENKSGQVKEMFAGIAGRYDFLNHFLSLGTDVYWRKVSVKRIRRMLARQQNSWLDLCCGTGDLTLELSRYGSVVGCDFCHPMLELARLKIQRRRNMGKKPALVEGDGLCLPFADASFDAIMAAFGVRNYADLSRGISEMRRVLRPGGVVGILEFSHPVVPVFRELFLFYFHRILPWIGRMVSGRSGAYSYLPASVDEFPDALEFKELLESCGFVETGFRRLTLGVAALHYGVCPADISGEDDT